MNAIEPEVLGFLAYAALVLLLAGLARAAGLTQPSPTNTHPAPVPTTGRGVLAQCSVEFCDVHPTISLHVGHESWEFCVEHGLPYLTEELKEEAS